MDENLVGYLLNALEPEEHERVEAQLTESATARERLELLRRGLEPLAADADGVEPPPGLRFAALALVAEEMCRKPPELRPAPLPRGTIGGATWWRRADVLVAACLLITALGLFIPWVVSLSNRGDGGPAKIVLCQENLRKLYGGLKTYADMKGGRFPDVAAAAESPRNVAGLVVPVLMEAGALTEPVSVRCPASGDPLVCKWTLKQLQDMAPEEFNKHVHSLAESYAYSLGYHSNGRPVGHRFDPNKPITNVPLMADCPPHDPGAGNSTNHGGKGQNVLYMDGSVKFCTAPTAGVERDHIFLNRVTKKVGAGADWDDAVLGRSAATP